MAQLKALKKFPSMSAHFGKSRLTPDNVQLLRVRKLRYWIDFFRLVEQFRREGR